MHYYKRNLGDYAKKAGRLSMLQHGSYTLLIDACYDRETFPTLEEAIEWTWASSTAEIEAVQFVLRKFFDLKDGVYVQKRIQEELDEYKAKSEKNTRIAKDRETKRKEKGTGRVQGVDESPPLEHESPPNHKPITNNHKPKDKYSAPPSAPPAGQGTRLTESWELPDDWKAWCTENRPDLDPVSVADGFRDFWIAKPGKDGRKADWKATWRNWCRAQKTGNRTAQQHEGQFV